MNAFSRRELSRAILAIGAFPLINPSVNGQSAGKQNAEPSIEEWMTTWQREAPAKALSGSLVVFKFKDPTYVTQKPLRWRPPSAGPGSDLAAVTVPTGFVTDFASIPRLFWSVLRPDADYAFAAVIHDYIFWNQDRTIGEANRIFRHAMEDLRIPAGVSLPLYAAVEAAGAAAWNNNAALKASGEKRILLSVPTDPATTWKEWKKRPEVFAR